MGIATLQQRTAVPVNLGLGVLPLEGSRAIGVNFDFTLGATSILNANLADLGMSMVQTMFIDNRNNLSAVTFQISGSNQFLACPPQSQAIFPILLMAKGAVSIIGASAGNVLVPVQLLNSYIDPLLWNAGNPLISGAVTVSGTVTAQPLTGAYTNRSGAIAAAGVSQQLAAANGTRRRLFILNPSTAAGQNIAAAERLFINFTTAAGIDDGLSIELQPGQSFDSGQGPMTTELITVNAATIAHRYIAKEM
jgi:hypothetical protein